MVYGSAVRGRRLSLKLLFVKRKKLDTSTHAHSLPPPPQMYVKSSIHPNHNLVLYTYNLFLFGKNYTKNMESNTRNLVIKFKQ